MNYEKVAQQIVDCIGGKENVSSHTHCVTRLRFQIVDKEKIDEPALKAIPEVQGVIDKGGIYQVIIGAEVDNLYVRVAKLLDAGGETKVETPKEEGKKNIFDQVLNYISACLSPVLPVLVVSGLLSAVLNICTTFNLMSSDSNTYVILNGMASAAFYFLPAFVAMAAAKRLKCNQYVAAFIALMVLHPNITALEDMSFFGISLVDVQYNSNIIPMILTMPLYAYLEHKFNDILPSTVKFILKPTLSVAIVIPILLFITGPIGTVISGWLADLTLFLSNYGAISMAIMALVTPILVLTGMHTVLLPLVINEMSSYGYSYVLCKGLASNFAIIGSVFAIAFLSKKKENKQAAISTGITGLLGATEPAIYGVLIRFQKSFGTTCIAAGIGGFLVGLVKLKGFSAAGPSLLTMPIFMEPGNIWNLVYAIGIAAITFAVAFALTYIVGIDEDAADVQE